MVPIRSIPGRNTMSEYIPAIRFTHETDLGGLNLYGLRALASLGDGTFRVATLPYPKDDAELATPNAEFAYSPDVTAL